MNLFVYLRYFFNFTSQFPRRVQYNQTYLTKLIDSRVQVLWNKYANRKHKNRVVSNIYWVIKLKVISRILNQMYIHLKQIQKFFRIFTNFIKKFHIFASINLFYDFLVLSIWNFSTKYYFILLILSYVHDKYIIISSISSRFT